MLNRFFLLGCFLVASVLLAAPQTASAQGATDAMVRLLQSGKLPESRVGTVVGMIAERGNAENLGILFQEATKPDGFSPALQKEALSALKKASESRNLVPAGDLSAVSDLIASDQAATKTLGIQLAGLWKVEATADTLAAIALNNDQPLKLRRLAIDSLIETGSDKTAATVAKLTDESQPLSIRYLGVSALANIDIQKAAEAAAKVLTSADTSTDPADMIDAFLADTKGPDALANALAGKELDGDVAKMCLRQMYSVGRSDQSLVDILSTAAGIDNNPDPLTDDQLQALVAKVLDQGDPARGEEVFRRKELSCLKCHAISGAGGQIGPDLSPVGATSPVDYVINSILFPEMAVKEAYIMKSIVDFDGKMHQGIVADENDDRTILKDANGNEIIIPADDIDLEKEGGSLMPKGLANFLTEEEFLDLVAYVAELGKPGPYGIRSEPTIQRWRALLEVPESLQGEANPSTGEFESQILGLEPDAWLPVYGKVNGELPLADLSEIDSPVLFLQAEIEVVDGGEIGISMNETKGVTAWIVDDEFPAAEEIKTDILPGRHKVTFRLDKRQFPGQSFRAVVTKPADSTAQYTVVGGS
ncbi:c-type cytochrome [Bremerella sp. T1]|uniref:c-type cytochrome n=1 Tax=Bremerella sp. TYQ1 TaxID=3119568 RepID=UPI001CCE20B1|nr:c-type cytochrome [Bremerella volcania]UBM35147.1 c-type cytochrome [Bremerella volcania]